MEDTILNVNNINENPNIKINTINDNARLFSNLQNLQTLIKKESSLKELCKNYK